MAAMPENSVDTVICDPPYGLEFMGAQWDKFGISAGRAKRLTRTEKQRNEDWDCMQGRGRYTEMTCNEKLSMQEFFQRWAAAALRVAKPGAMLAAFGGTRTWHRLTCAIEDVGWQIRDTMMWVYGSGFPKSLDISKAIDKRGGKSVGWFGGWLRNWREKNGITQKEIARLFPSKNGGTTGCVANWELGLNMPTAQQFSQICKKFNLPFKSIEEAEREIVGHNDRGAGGTNWFTTAGNFDITAPATKAAKLWNGWGTALKPAWEPIVLAMKPLDGTFAENALKWGVAGMAIDRGRVESAKPIQTSASKGVPFGAGNYPIGEGRTYQNKGRWPANLLHDGSPEVMAEFAKVGERKSCGVYRNGRSEAIGSGQGTTYMQQKSQGTIYSGDTGSAARFFYCAKASRAERGNGNNHPTVKPIALMAYLCKLLATPTGGVVLDPFAGSGSTGIACKELGREFIGIEIDKDYCQIARKRIAAVKADRQVSLIG